MSFFGPICIVALLLLVGLAMQAARKENSLTAFLRGFVLSFLGLLLPLFIFIASAFLVPDWKGACRHGWIDCFHEGKLVLTPFVIWAVSALYTLDIYQVDEAPNWITMGVFLGAIISTACFGLGLYVGVSDSNAPWLLVPAYISGWLIIRAFQFISSGRLKPATCLVAVISSLPFWLGAVFWTRRVYQSLPDKPSNCFIVTAAARGHRRVVGPFLQSEHLQSRDVNRQLATLWQFEACWRQAAPVSHAGFRKFYNRLGPLIARQVCSPWIADFVYLALKPAEWMARFWLCLRGYRDSSFRQN